MLKTLMMRREIDRKKKELEEIRAKDADFLTREADLTNAINEAAEGTDEEREAVKEEVEKYDSDKAAHEEQKENLQKEIEELEGQLSDIERNAPTPNKPERKTERRHENLTINIRKLPANQRAFDALPMEQRNAILAQDDVKTFLAQLRSMKGQNRAISGGELTIPLVFLDIISENVFRYSKLMNRVRVRTVNGEARQVIGGTVPPAVWTECCGAFNEMQFVFNAVTAECYKVAGFVLVCNSLLADSDINLAGEILEMVSESIGLAKDMAILYGKGGASKMPTGIVTRLAQQSKPADYPSNAPAWVDLHSTNIISISADLTGAAFWAALRVATGKTFTKYSRGELFWAMNSKTYALLESKAIATTVTGEWVALIGGRLPIVSGDVDVLEFIPDGDIIGGYGDLYLWAQRSGMELGTEMNGFTLRVTDNTLFWGKERADGMPIIAGAFVAINIAGQSVTTEIPFPGDIANDAALQGLTIGALTLSPTFAADTMTYTASAANNVSSAVVTATANEPGAEISISVTSGSTTKNVNNGAAAALAVGANVIAVTVKKGNATRVYSVTVTRAAS